ncbi:hypothetical protein, partial [Carboxylicivirga marina]|uniref:hypothetical protein n=1 Tax=Carboxylicivirga marina TaxID=2800988 RepID=UPI0025927DAF
HRQTTPKADLALELKVNTKYSALAQHILERSKDYSPFQRHVARPLDTIRIPINPKYKYGRFSKKNSDSTNSIIE